MKKILYSLLAVIAVFSMGTFSSCSEDNEEFITATEAIVSKIIFRSKNIVRPISQLVEKQMNYS